MKRCGLYVRVSSDEQARDPEGSLKSQTQRLQEELAEKNRQGGDVWREERLYVERGRSGKDTNRPEFQAMLKDVEQERLDIVLCTELSRISRSVVDFLHFVQFLKDRRVEFLALKQRFDTTTPYGKVLITICVALAEFERELTSERTRENMMARARRGLWNGAVLFGYDSDPSRKGYLIPNPQEAATVSLAFDLYLKLGSLKQVAVELNRRGYRRKDFVSKRGRHHRDRKFSQQGVEYLLTNVGYIGLKELNKKRRHEDQDALPERDRYGTVQAVWSALIDREKFEHVQALLAKNRHTKHNVTAYGQHVFLLSGLLRCGHCDVPLEGASGTSKTGQVHHYYRHPPRQRHPECRLPSLAAAALEALVLDRLGYLSEDEELLREIAEEAATRSMTEQPHLKTLLVSRQEELQRLNQEAEAWLRKSLDFSREQIEEFISPKLVQISDQKRLLRAEIAKLETTLAEAPTSPVILADLKEALTSFKELCCELPPHKQKELLAQLASWCVVRLHQLELMLRTQAQQKDVFMAGHGIVTIPITIKRGAHGKWMIRERACPLWYNVG